MFRRALAAALFASLSLPALAQVMDDPMLTVTTLSTPGLSQPTTIGFVALGDMLVLEKATGQVKRILNNVLQAQVALMRRDTETAAALLQECAGLQVEEPEPHQHRLLTQAWLLRDTGYEPEATELLRSAMEIFPEKRRVGDHTVHLLARLSRHSWASPMQEELEGWRRSLMSASKS